MPQSTISPNPDAKKKRRETSKRLRFEVFKRDHFTCQYCGAQPPDVVLVCDHVTPVAAGGMTTVDNLVAACEACNQGKADKSIDGSAPRPDARLLFLETQQETVELWQYYEALNERERILSYVVTDLQTLWADCSGLTWFPSDHVIRKFLALYSPIVVEESIRAVAPKISDGYVDGAPDRWIRYMHGVARNIARQSEIDGDEEGE